ncbi:MAG: restriction endonuclease [Pseudolabrys sp.]|nr:restriction endonuclease [Pseudolabrys sp.]
MISDDEYLERVVAGIQAVTTTEAEVNWNETIDGRQFDVVVRFKVGTLRYLVVVEVKNRKRPASAEMIEAFITKARDRNANKIVFVTTGGYQSGAMDVARKHDISLFTVSFDETKPRLPETAAFLSVQLRERRNGEEAELSIGEDTLITNIVDLKLRYTDGKTYNLPDEQSQAQYYMGKTKADDGRSLHELLSSAAFAAPALDETRPETLSLNPPIAITPPDEYFFPRGSLVAIEFKAVGRMGKPIRGNVRVDPNLFTLPVVYTNMLSGESFEFPLESLPIGEKRVSPGEFYCGYHPLAYYYCVGIQNDTVTWKVVESFQSGELVRAQTKQHVKYSCHYLPVTDKKLLNRLQSRLEDYDRLSAQPGQPSQPKLRGRILPYGKDPFGFSNRR